jgi:hypothetical protein
VPCAWTIQDGERPHIVKKFSYSFSNGATLIYTLLIKKLPVVFTKAQVAELLTDEELTKSGKETGTVVSVRKVKIDGIDCGEIITKQVRETPVSTLHLEAIFYQIFYKDNLIHLTFATSGINENDCNEAFNLYAPLFKGLAMSLVLLSKW